MLGKISIDRIIAILKNAGAIEGIKKTFKEFSAPINRAASETKHRNGDIILVKVTVVSNFPGSLLKLGAKRPMISGEKIKINPERARVKLPSRIKRDQNNFRAFSGFSWFASTKVGTNAEENAPSAKRSLKRFGIR
jgi:hypothetical protein